MNVCNNKFGILIRDLRHKNGDTLRGLATKLNVSAAFISSLELGRKQIPADYVEKITEIYNLNKEEQEELIDAINSTNEKITLNLKELNEEQKDLSLIFARKIKTSDDDLINTLREILYEDND